MKDICVQVDGFTVNIRVAAILRNDDTIMVNQLKSNDFWFLPGGRVAAGETFQESLARELGEELLCNFEIGALAFICENFFTYGERKFHEICAFFEVDCTPSFDQNLERLEDAETRFHWLPVAELRTTDLRPHFLKNALLDPTYEQKHVIIRNP